jgi:hypothetical protein
MKIIFVLENVFLIFEHNNCRELLTHAFPLLIYMIHISYCVLQGRYFFLDDK